MTGATHVAIAVCCGLAVGEHGVALSLIAGGALCPDLDTSRSTIGRLFFPISIPLSRWCGHRGAIHSFWLWGILIIAGLIWKPLLYIGAGAWLHIIADCGTVSGVRALSPFSQVLFVFFKRSWRIKTGSNAEFAIMLVFAGIAYGSHSISTIGGIGAMIGQLTGNPKIMYEEFRNNGLLKCRVSGKWRWNNGNIEEVEWEIVGLEGSSGMAFFNGKKIIRMPENGKFMKAYLKKTKEKRQQARLNGWFRSKVPCFFLSNKKWYYVEEGLVFGEIVADKLKFEHEDNVKSLDIALH